MDYLFGSGNYYYPGSMTYITNMAISNTAGWWLNLGEVPQGTSDIVIVMQTPQGSSGIVWLDAVELVPIGEEPTH